MQLVFKEHFKGYKRIGGGTYRGNIVVHKMKKALREFSFCSLSIVGLNSLFQLHSILLQGIKSLKVRLDTWSN